MKQKKLNYIFAGIAISSLLLSGTIHKTSTPQNYSKQPVQYHNFNERIAGYHATWTWPEWTPAINVIDNLSQKNDSFGRPIKDSTWSSWFWDNDQKTTKNQDIKKGAEYYSGTFNTGNVRTFQVYPHGEEVIYVLIVPNETVFNLTPDPGSGLSYRAWFHVDNRNSNNGFPKFTDPIWYGSPSFNMNTRLYHELKFDNNEATQCTDITLTQHGWQNDEDIDGYFSRTTSIKHTPSFYNKQNYNFTEAIPDFIPGIGYSHSIPPLIAINDKLPQAVDGNKKPLYDYIWNGNFADNGQNTFGNQPIVKNVTGSSKFLLPAGAGTQDNRNVTTLQLFPNNEEVIYVVIIPDDASNSYKAWFSPSYSNTGFPKFKDPIWHSTQSFKMYPTGTYNLNIENNLVTNSTDITISQNDADSNPYYSNFSIKTVINFTNPI